MSEETQQSATQATPATLDLAMQRRFALVGKSSTYVLVCRRVKPEDWEAYYAALVIASQQDGRDVVSNVDLDTPRRVLAERVIVDAVGYTVAGGGKLAELENWQKLIPLAHRLKIGQLLAEVEPSDEGDEVIYPEGERVLLNARWGGEMYKGLVHTLAVPSEELYQRFSSQSSRTRVLGGSRTGTTLYPGSQTLLAKLYDELVISVDGYVNGGRPLNGRAEIAQEMDMHHKVSAAMQLFQPRTQVIAEEAKAA